MDEFDGKDTDNASGGPGPEEINPEAGDFPAGDMDAELYAEDADLDSEESDSELNSDEAEYIGDESGPDEIGTAAERTVGGRRGAAPGRSAGQPKREQPKSGKSKKDSKLTLTQRVTEWYKGLRAEFRKIVWPSPRELARQSTTVMLTSLLFGVIIVFFDFISSEALAIFGGIVLKQ